MISRSSRTRWTPTRTIPGRTCFPLRLEGAQAVAVDRNVTLTDSRTHPAYAVDEWRVTSTPTEE